MDDTINQFVVAPIALTTVTKTAIDVLRVNFPDAATKLVILAAVVTGPLLALLLMLARGTPVTSQSVALAMLQGIMSSLGAIGVNRLGNKAQEATTNEQVRQANASSKRRSSGTVLVTPTDGLEAETTGLSATTGAVSPRKPK